MCSTCSSLHMHEKVYAYLVGTLLVNGPYMHSLHILVSNAIKYGTGIGKGSFKRNIISCMILLAPICICACAWR